MRLRLDLSAESRTRVILFTTLGTLLCIAVSLVLDSYSFEKGWHWGQKPINNVTIPLVLAPPLLYFLLSKLRELAIAHRELLIISTQDSLTDCFNRRAFTALVDRYLERIFERSSRAQGALLVIDVDHFKKVNDSYGHETGDAALKLIAETIRSEIRETDADGRIGGEEFSVFLPGVNFPQAETTAERIRAAVSSALFAPRGPRHKLSVSIGGAAFEGSSSFGELYRRADSRLYEAKRGGRNRVEFPPSEPAEMLVSATVH